MLKKEHITSLCCLLLYTMPLLTMSLDMNDPYNRTMALAAMTRMDERLRALPARHDASLENQIRADIEKMRKYQIDNDIQFYLEFLENWKLPKAGLDMDHPQNRWMAQNEMNTMEQQLKDLSARYNAALEEQIRANMEAMKKYQIDNVIKRYSELLENSKPLD